MSQEITEFLERNPEWAVCPDFIISPPSGEELAQDYPELTESFLGRHEEYMSYGVTRGAQYAQMRLNGTAHSLAEMVALQQCAGIETDDTFFQGSKPLYDQFGSQKHLNTFLKAAKRRGFTPSVNSTYFPGLARFQGDPEAFVTRAQGRSYIRKLCEKRGWACEGGVNVKHREPESDPLDLKNCKPLGEDIIRNRAMQMAEKNPDVARMPRRELREKIIAEHGPSQ